MLWMLSVEVINTGRDDHMNTHMHVQTHKHTQIHTPPHKHTHIHTSPITE